MDRRAFIKNAASAAATIPFTALMARVQDGGIVRAATAGYGPIAPVLDQTTGLPLLHLPAGFSYLSLGWTGDAMGSGLPTPGAHDGMAAFPAGGSLVRLVRNHELGNGTPFSSAYYDIQASGGTTTVWFDSKMGQVVKTEDSLSGTIRNCAGGPTPWRSWLTCEETTAFNMVPHGYVFEVPSDGLGDPTPIRDMGRFSHEALALDRRTGNVYLTEDAGRTSGFYKFVPNTPGLLSDGGTLYMLKVVGQSNVDLGVGYANNTSFAVEWVLIDTPDDPSSTMPGNFVWAQGQAKGAATFARLEGCWTHANQKIYIVSTNGGAVSQGQIWEYSPVAERIRLVFESPSSAVLNAPDNITVSPDGSLMLCEDGGGEEFVHGLTIKGEIYQFAKNGVVLNGERNGITGNFSGSEFAGACFSPDRKWFFVNIQSPGITLAITGPWNWEH